MINMFLVIIIFMTLFLGIVKTRLEELLKGVPGTENFVQHLRDARSVWEIPEIMERYFRIDGNHVSENSKVDAFTVLEGGIYIGEGSVVNPFTVVKGPAYVGRNCRIGPGAFLRQGVIIGDTCAVGHSTEVKNSVILDRSNAPHRNHVGDSVIGVDGNLGDGTKLANFRLDGKDIEGRYADRSFSGVKRRKLGAILEDGCKIGCNVVLSPGQYLAARTGMYVDRAAYVVCDLGKP